MIAIDVVPWIGLVLGLAALSVFGQTRPFPGDPDLFPQRSPRTDSGRVTRDPPP